MARVTTAEDLSALHLTSQGTTFTPRPHSTQNSASLCGSRQRSIKSAAATPVSSVPDPTLFSWDIGQILLQKTAEKPDELKEAFQMHDVGQTVTVTKGECRRVIETFLFHLTEAEFDAVLAEIAKNVKNLIRCCRLLDYSRAGWIQRHTLRQILEITCFRMKASEFEKLWNCYCVRDSNVMVYKEFLKNFGISTDTVKEKSTENEVPAYQDIEKASRAIDVSQSGFVSLDYLKSVINGFIFPLPNESFQELMNRFGLKATGKIAWQQFLEKSREPGSTFKNSQTISMRNKHKVIPARGGEAFSHDAVLQKLHSYIQDAYPSLKQVFFMLDKKGDGEITRKDLRRVLRNLVFQMKNKDFQELIEIIDPEQTGYLGYHEFLDLFEEKESVFLSKYAHILSGNGVIINTSRLFFLKHQLESNLVVTGDFFKNSSRIINLVDCKVEEILLDKITENWKDFHKVFQSCGPKCTGTINRSHLSPTAVFCSSLSDQQFMKIRQTEGQANKYNQNRTVDEVIKRLNDSDIQAATIKDSFVAYNNQSHGNINKACLWKVLEDHGMPMDGSKFNLPTEKIVLPGGGLSFLDFVAILEDHRLKDSKYHYMTAEECLSQLNDELMEAYFDTNICFKKCTVWIPTMDIHRVRKITFYKGEKLQLLLNCVVHPTLVPWEKRKDQRSGKGSSLQTILDTSSKADHIDQHYFRFLKNRTILKAFEHLASILMGEAVQLTDQLLTPILPSMKQSNRDGIINMPTFRQFLYRFLLHLGDEEFLRLLGLLGMNLTSTLNYQEFCQLFHTQGTKEMIMDAELACDHAHYYLVIKARTRWHDLAREFDSEGNDIIQPRDLKKVLFRFGIPITLEEFKQLWARYDTDAKGYLTHQEFLQSLYPLTQGSADTSQETKHSNLEEQQKQQTKSLRVREIKKQIKDKFRDYFQDFNKAFHKVDKNRDGYVAVCDLQRILQEFSCYLDHDQFSSLLNRFESSIHDSKLSSFGFLRAIDDGRASKYQRQKQAAPPASFAALSLEQALIKIKEIVASPYDLLYKAFSLFDKEDTGVIKALKFWQVLDHFCFKLSDKQFRHFLKNFNICEDFTVDCKAFLKNVNILIETEEGHKVIPPKSSWELSERGILSPIRVVTAGFNKITQEFKDIDSSKDNAVSKEEFWDICNHFQGLTEEQFENLWNTVDVSADRQLKYQDFLKKFNSELVMMASGTPRATNSATSTKPATHAVQDPNMSSQPECLKTQSSLVGQKSIPASSRPQTTPACSAPILTCEKIENKIRKNIQSWRGILKVCKEKDVSKLGEIPVSDFLDITEKFDLDLREEEINQITSKYDLKKNGRFAYYDFLQSCVLLLKPQESSLLQRVIIQKPQKPLVRGFNSLGSWSVYPGYMLSPGPQTTSFLSTMLRIQPQILHCWRPMKRTFKSYHESRTGLLNTADFRQVLHEYRIDLTEEELFNILEYYDKNLSSKIPYNDFLRAFIQ
ncbi:LOW QUALITY PROTEIN: EF-hand calcium-binding domain-containing protein 6 [Pterocles gutturalis]